MIPKVIHYCWFGGNPKPKSVIKCINSWKKFCPDYIIKEWTEEDLDISMNVYAKEAYESNAWSFVSDYMHLWIIYNYGGIYLDTDVQIVRKFDKLLAFKAFAGMEDLKRVNFGLGFGAEPKNEIIKQHMDLYDKLHFINSDGTLNRLPSPNHTTNIMVKNGFQPGKNEIQNVGDFVVFPPEYFCPKDFVTGITNVTKNTYSIHQFDGSWCTDEELAYKNNRWKEAKKDYIRHFPNRVAMRILGEVNYKKLKRLLGK